LKIISFFLFQQAQLSSKAHNVGGMSSIMLRRRAGCFVIFAIFDVLRVFPPLKRCTYARGFRLHDEGVFWYKACELFNEVKVKYMLKKDGDEVDGAMSCEVFVACY